MKKSTCQQCQTRSLGCHIHCPTYQAWKQTHQTETQWLKEKRLLLKRMECSLRRCLWGKTNC